MSSAHDSPSQPGITLRGRTVLGVYYAISTLFMIGLYHAVALLAFTPYFFYRWAFALLALGVFLHGLLGINLGYHRLLTHRSFSCSKTVEYLLAVLGLLSLQMGPAQWVALHRRHHQFADEWLDPHSPREGFFRAHMGWLFALDENGHRDATMAYFARDLLRDPFYAWLEKRFWWATLVIASWAAYFGLGFVMGWLWGDGLPEAVHVGAIFLIWGVFVRTVVVWHLTWSVNSLSHLWGYRNYDTPDDSRNNILIGILSFGEGWHNNHHAFPHSARHGLMRWEFDASWLVLRGLKSIGLATVRTVDLDLPPKNNQAR